MELPTDSLQALVADSQSVGVSILFVGAFGGLLFGLRETGLRIPRWVEEDNALDLGFLVDVFFGLAGSIVIFLVIPAQLEAVNNFEDWFKIMGLALVGGYGGPALLEKVLDQTVRDLAKETRLVKGELEKQKTLLEKEVFEQRAIDRAAFHLVDVYLEDTESESREAGELLAALEGASIDAKKTVFAKAREVRRGAWRRDPEAMSRTIPVFEALLAAGMEDDEHRVRANLAYALKDQPAPEYDKALALLDQAIDQRAEAGLAPSSWYHFNRAVCVAESARAGQALDAWRQAQAAADIDIARRNARMAQAIEDTPELGEWRKVGVAATG